MKHNKNDIILAIECHKKGECHNCPYEHIYECLNTLCDSTIEFINETTAKTEAQDITISELRKLLEKANHDADRYACKIKELTEVVEQSETARGCKENIDNDFSPSVTESQRENEKLKAQKYYLHSDGRIEMIPTIESVKANTVRKMQERCNKLFRDNYGYRGDYIRELIDQIAKEMLDEG